MSELSLTAPSHPDLVLYARLHRRIQAVAVDGAILASLLLLGPTLAGSLPDSASRFLNRAVLVCILFYEPVLVSVRGSTIGHQLLNLQVVSSTTGGRLPFLRALLRSLIKAVFGIFSFFSIAFTRRYQALHDMVAAAVVQVRDPARASPAGFATERVPDGDPGAAVSPLRRAGVVIGYVVVTFVLFGLTSTVVVSVECIAAEVCSRSDDDRMTVLVLILLALMAAIVVLGWRGRLPGARRREPDAVQQDEASLTEP